MSFGPFLGGKRVCLGKTFADMIGRIVTPNLLNNFELEFVDKTQKINKPINNVNTFFKYNVLITVKERN